MEQLELDSAAQGVESQLTGKKKRRKKPNGYWFKKENLKNESLKYKTKSEFKSKNQAAYRAMYKLGLSDEFFPNGKKSNGYWSEKRLIAECLKYSDVSEFYNSNPSAYKAARQFESCVAIVDKMNRNKYRCGYWTKEKVRQEALKYKTINEFKLNSSGAYCRAREGDFIHEIISHMKSGYKSTNCTYVWKVSGKENLYKIGVSNSKTLDHRIMSVCSSSGFACEWVKYKVNRNPLNKEKSLLRYGINPLFDKFDGYTEFRILSGNELAKVIKELYE